MSRNKQHRFVWDDAEVSVNVNGKVPLGKWVQTVDLFCGGGGFATGAEMAGAEVVVAIDCWMPALNIHHANHPNTKHFCIPLGGDMEPIAQLIRAFLDKGAHFHLHGSPPCQDLSNANANGNPEEGMVLVNWFLDFVKYIQPDSWSMENVVGVRKFLVSDDVPHVVLNSADFGVPQTRKRVFAGAGWKAVPTCDKADWVSVIEALPHLEGELEAVPSMVERWSKLGVNGQFPTVTSQSPKQIRVVSRRRKSGEEPQSYDLSGPAHTVTQVQHIMENIHLNTAGVGASIGEAAVAKDREITSPSKVIRGHSVSLRDKTDPLAPVKIRSLTLQETATLQGFPDGYQLPYRIKNDAWVVIGNAVCPAVAEAVIRGIN